MKPKRNLHLIWLRCASFVTAQLAKAETRAATGELKGFGDLATELDQQQSRISLAQSRGWKVAEAKVRSDYCRLLRRFREKVESEIKVATESSRWIASEAELFRDLQVLKEEFVSVVFDHKEKRLLSLIHISEPTRPY